MQNRTEFESLRGTSAPARRALKAAGYAYLEELDGVSERSLAALHGMGPKVMALIKAGLAERGMKLAD